MGLWRMLTRHATVVIAVCVWLPIVGFGIRTLLAYSFTAGRPAAPVETLPRGTPVRPVSGHASLVVFLHPQCPCSRASIGELALIMARSREKVETTAFFYLPASEPEAWAHTDLWREAAAIPGVHPVIDRQAAMARTFGAFTSGQTLLYDSSGHLVFSGGITAYRGHSGDNAGRDSIVAWLQDGATPRTRTAVFGCSLMGEQ